MNFFQDKKERYEREYFTCLHVFIHYSSVHWVRHSRLDESVSRILNANECACFFGLAAKELNLQQKKVEDFLLILFIFMLFMDYFSQHKCIFILFCGYSPYFNVKMWFFLTICGVLFFLCIYSKVNNLKSYWKIAEKCLTLFFLRSFLKEKIKICLKIADNWAV